MDDYRVTFEVRGRRRTRRLARAIRARVPRAVSVSHSPSAVFLYASSEAEAAAARRRAHALLDEHGIESPSTLERWNPGDGCWQDPSAPVRPAPSLAPVWVDLAELQWEVVVTLPAGVDVERTRAGLWDDGFLALARGRTLTVPAATREEALAVLERVVREQPLAKASVRPLTRWRSWRLRQRLAGSYAADDHHLVIAYHAGADGGGGGGSGGGGGGGNGGGGGGGGG